jgi:Protein of unknown function (DUF3047)
MRGVRRGVRHCRGQAVYRLPAVVLALACSLSLLAAPVFAQDIQPFSTTKADTLPAPWRLVGLPNGKAPLAQLDITTLGSERVLRLATDKSYGTALHELKPAVLAPGRLLKWRWRLEQALPLADLKRKNADDAALKVCAMFDMPLDKLGFLERNLVRLARNASGEKIPGATLCYVWDHQLPVGTELPNIYSKRLRYIVLDSGEQKLGQWVSHERDLAADLQRVFGHEFDAPPPLIAIVVGADSDNTQGKSLAYLGDVGLAGPASGVKKTE